MQREKYWRRICDIKRFWENAHYWLNQGLIPYRMYTIIYLKWVRVWLCVISPKYAELGENEQRPLTVSRGGYPIWQTRCPKLQHSHYIWIFRTQPFRRAQAHQARRRQVPTIEEPILEDSSQPQGSRAGSLPWFESDIHLDEASTAAHYALPRFGNRCTYNDTQRSIVTAETGDYCLIRHL